jgi:hypothetical protein
MLSVLYSINCKDNISFLVCKSGFNLLAETAFFFLLRVTLSAGRLALRSIIAIPFGYYKAGALLLAMT